MSEADITLTIKVNATRKHALKFVENIKEDEKEIGGGVFYADGNGFEVQLPVVAFEADPSPYDAPLTKGTLVTVHVMGEEIGEIAYHGIVLHHRKVEASADFRKLYPDAPTEWYNYAIYGEETQDIHEDVPGDCVRPVVG
jgi:hypothetical protein